MERTAKKHSANATKTASKQSPVSAILSWLVETGREFRATQSMVNETNDRF